MWYSLNQQVLYSKVFRVENSKSNFLSQIRILTFDKTHGNSADMPLIITILKYLYIYIHWFMAFL